MVEEDWSSYERLASGEIPESEDEDETSEDNNEMPEMLQRMSEALEQAKEAKKVPHRDEVLFEGGSGKFLRASMVDLGHIPQQALADHDAAMASLGFRSIGDSVADIDQRQEITRCYAGHPQAIGLLSHRNENNRFGWAPVSDGMVMVDFSSGTREFHTHFEDATSLVTTSIDAITSKPDVGIYVRCYEDIPVSELWEKHADGIARFKQHRGTEPIDHTKFTDHSQFLARTEELMCRFLGM